ncbi:peptidylprolyl isomerase [Nocardia sp. CDC159]|uniref:Peptidyl-prolyl cis-trans isomerase n=1 Tax=Nocardia pulmonis TaxID=2951408 RepID=A0A9X2EC98_9NOCA|nr:MULTISPECIES: peptidylprolyl isomerase [Nocardia]MCM6775516.1 peptidylprolyl isomerase [Nocardia pulmonis]MCM6787750.1 peptidylprolyl isomerase [Nocardia sp. CDC159]
MQSVPQTPQLDPTLPVRRNPRRRKTLRRLGLVAAGVSLAILVTGRAFAMPAHTETPGCLTAAPGQPKNATWPVEPAMAIDQSATYTANLQTNCGTIAMTLDAARAPHTVNSFKFLSDQEYFNNTRCHRLTTESIFVLQCGDPTATGTGSPGYQFADENLDGATYPAGTVAMANAGPNTNGSQFFLVYSDTQLPPKYTPFAHITSGMDVLQNIARGGTRDGSPDGAPASDIVLQTVTTIN